MGSSEIALILGFLAVVVPVVIYVVDYRIKRKQHHAILRAAPQRDVIDAPGVKIDIDLADIDLRAPLEVVDVTVPMPARLAAGTTSPLFGFVGRESEMTELDQVRKRAEAGPGLVVAFVTGEAGIGKSTLVSHAATVAQSAGATVLYGHCDDLAVPYQPWLEAITHLASHRPSSLRALPPPQRHAIGRLLPTLATEILAPPVDPDTERLVFMEAVATLLRNAAASAPLVVVFDDLHWADRATLQLLRRLVASHLAAGIVVIGTYRDTDLVAGDPLSSLIADFHREPSVSRISLTGLDDQDVQALLTAAAGHDIGDEGADLAHALQRETAGNPFFTTELLRNLSESGAVYQDEEGRWTLRQDPSRSGLPSSVREVVGRRVERLGPETTRVLSLAAVIGTEFDVDLLAELAAVDDGALLDLLDNAVKAAVVIETDMPGHYRFAHALVQHTLYGDLSATRRQRAHLRIAEALEEAGGKDAEQLSELAHHWLAATKPTDPLKTVHYVEQAGDAALAALAPEDAMRWYTTALELLGPAEQNTELRCRLLVSMGRAQLQSGRPEYRDTLVQAGQLAKRLGATELLVAAVLAGSGTMTIADEDPERLALARAALDALGPADSAARAELLGAAVEFMSAADLDQRAVLGQEAIDIAQRVGDDMAITLTSSMIELIEPSRIAQVATKTAQIAAADRTGSPRLAANVRRTGVYVALACADLTWAKRLYAELQDFAAQTNLPPEAVHVEVVKCLLSTMECDFATAEAAAGEALRLNTELGVPEALGQFGGQLFDLRRQQGRLDEIAEFFVEAAANSPNMPVLQVAVGTLHIEAGDHAAAEQIIAPLLANGSVSFPRDQTWLLAMMHFAEIVARLGHIENSRLLARQLAPYSGEVSSPGAVVQGAVARPLGLLATTLGEHDQAEAHFHTALELHERIETPFWTAITQLDYADLLLTRRAPGDAPKANELRESALTTAQRFGLAGLERRVALSGFSARRQGTA